MRQSRVFGDSDFEFKDDAWHPDSENPKVSRGDAAPTPMSTRTKCDKELRKKPAVTPASSVSNFVTPKTNGKRMPRAQEVLSSKRSRSARAVPVSKERLPSAPEERHTLLGMNGENNVFEAETPDKPPSIGRPRPL